MLNIKRQLKYIYTIQLLENYKKDIKNIFYYIPIILKKQIKKNNYLKEIKKNKNKKILNSKKKIKLITLNKDKYLNLKKKYKYQLKIITNIDDLNKINKEILYCKFKIEYYNNNILNLIKIYNKNNLDLQNIKKKIKTNKKYFFKKKEIYNNIYIEYKKKYKFIKSLLYKIKKKINNYKIYKKYRKIKKNSNNNIGIVSLYKKQSIDNVYLVIPKYKYYMVKTNKKVVYDDYTDKILIDSTLANKVKKNVLKIINF
ncbi:MAG: hypothetical protein NHG14_01010 [Candidatus Shikimatogenerans bostrichidophilus]|nr:MAG: hypothetical protein NHG14_01010 [Candidatus Shikimatogenerans bostrichidophilus]